VRGCAPHLARPCPRLSGLVGCANSVGPRNRTICSAIEFTHPTGRARVTRAATSTPRSSLRTPHGAPAGKSERRRLPAPRRPFARACHAAADPHVGCGRCRCRRSDEVVKPITSLGAELHPLQRAQARLAVLMARVGVRLGGGAVPGVLRRCGQFGPPARMLRR
jgi:hypothetical protein